MRKVILFTLLLIVSNANASFLGIVDRTATRDTLAIPFCLLDSIGSPTTLASGDSVYVNVFAPGGVEVFDDSMAYNDASIKSSDWEDYAGVQYMYMEQVSVLDGASTADGVFTVHVTVQDLTSAALTTTVMHTFQIVNSTLESSLDSAGLALIAANKAIDSLADVLDSLELYDTRFDSLLAALADANIGDKVWADGSPATRGEINDILDTLQSQDDWIALATELTKAIDSINGILDSIQDVMGVNAIQISGDANAADSLEIFLDGTGTMQLELSALHILGNDADTAPLFVHNAGNFHAGVIRATVAGMSGLYLLGGPTTGSGLHAGGGWGAVFEGGASGRSGISISSQTDTWPALLVTTSTANTDGIKIDGHGTRHDIYLAGDGQISDGTNTVFMTNNYEDLWDEVSIGCIVEDSTGNSTTRLQTNLAEATNDHYNGMMVFFIDGTEARTARRITDYDGTNGYIVFDPALTGTPASGDSLRIMTWASVSATATISDADMGAIGDTVWLKDTTGLLDAGTYGLEATTGGAANITDADMGAIADSVWDKIWADAVNVAGGMGDSLEIFLDKLRDSLYAVIDSIQIKYANRTAFDNNSQEVIIAPSHATNLVFADTIANRVKEDSAVYQARGAGIYPIKIYTLDTSGTPNLVPNVRIAVWSTSLATLYATGSTENADSGLSVSLNAGDYVIMGALAGYMWPLDTFSISGVDTITDSGYDIASAYPTGTKSCYVTGRIIGFSGQPGDTIRGIPNVLISIQATKSRVVDSAGNVISTAQPIMAMTNNVGNWGAYVIYSAYMIPSMPWQFTVQLPSGYIKAKVTVPSQPTGIFKKDSDGRWGIE